MQITDKTEIRDKYAQEELDRVIIRGDGYCMVQSILKSMESERREVPTKEEMMKDIHKMLYEQIEEYRHYINADTDPIAEIEDYIKHGKYNAAISDLLIPMISKCLEVRIVILHANKRELTYELQNKNHIIAPDNYKDTIYIEKCGEHYNTLVTKEINPLRKEEQSNNNEKKEKRNVKMTKKMENYRQEEKKKKGMKKTTENGNKGKYSNERTEESNIENTRQSHEEVTSEHEKDTTNGETQNEKETLYCTCKEPYTEGVFMLQCKGCEEWYHPKCITYDCTDCKEEEEKERERKLERQ